MASNKYYPHQIGLKSKQQSFKSSASRSVSVDDKSAGGDGSAATAATQPFSSVAVNDEPSSAADLHDKQPNEAAGSVALTLGGGSSSRQERKRRYQLYVDALEPPRGCCAGCVRLHRRMKKMNGGYPMWPIYLVVALFVPAFLYFVWYATIR